jgi:methionine synthase II (cobalamin-independent)
MRQDLDVLAEVADGYQGLFKVQVAGPWTLAGSLHLPRLERAVVDPGACRDLVDSLAEGVRRLLAEVQGLVPRAELVLQLDEPSLGAVLSGTIPTASGIGRLRAVEEQVVVEGLRLVLAAAAGAGAGTVLHCCAAAPPVPVLARARPDALSLDVGLLGEQGWEQLGTALDEGVALWAGVVPVTDPGERPTVVADAVSRPWRKIGLPAEGLADVVVTPTCGLAGLVPAAARRVLARTARTAAALAEQSAG